MIVKNLIVCKKKAITSEELSDAIQNASEQDLYYASEDVKNFIRQNGGE